MPVPDTSQDGMNSLAKVEHSSDAKAKRVIIRQLDPSSGNYVTVSAVDAGDGTYGIQTLSGLIPKAYDDLVFTNADANGNYQTLTVKKGATTVATITFTYDNDSKLTRAVRS